MIWIWTMIKKEVEYKEYSIKTRFFSDCFSSYQESDFNNIDLILKLVSHSVIVMVLVVLKPIPLNLYGKKSNL